MPEFDEFGIPIKKKSSPQVDEFGIPIKKKVPTESNGPVVKTSGSLESPKEEMQQPLVSSGQAGEAKLPNDSDFIPIAETEPNDDVVYTYKHNQNAGYKKEGG